jgi:PHP family Zn ribbon phosphoesterase
MRFIADLHIHSKYARAVSSRMTLPVLDRFAVDKGIQVLGTGDFTHPLWFKHLQNSLEPSYPGLYKLKKSLRLENLRSSDAETQFLLATEIACVYTRGGRGRRVHVLLFAPDLAIVKKINNALIARGANIRSDGRPIVGIDVVELLKIALSAHPDCVLIPAHIWTPWFGVIGSKSGFNTLEECFGEYTKYIFAIESGLSSDPVMNWRLSALDNIAIISNSDSHSPEKIGREANIFDTDLSYAGIMGGLRNSTSPFPKGSTAEGREGFRNPPSVAKAMAGKPSPGDHPPLRKEELIATIEYFPEEGMYHYDGHRDCKVSYSPTETLNKNGLCRICKKPVTVGVLGRLEKLADRSSEAVNKEIIEFKLGEVLGKKYQNRVPFVNLVTLNTIIAEALGVGASSKRVGVQYINMIKNLGTEIDILMNLPISEFEGKKIDLNPRIIEGISRMRAGELIISPGFDGQYGKVKIFDLPK